MRQILLNWLGIVGMPVILGAGLRILCRRMRQGYAVTMGLMLLAAAVWTAARIIPAHGSELWGLLSVQTCSAALASLLTSADIRLSGKR